MSTASSAHGDIKHTEQVPIRHRRFLRTTNELLSRLLFVQEYGKRGLRPSARHHEFAGLLEGSILGSEIAYPDFNGRQIILHTQHAMYGKVVGYDFKRPIVFKKQENVKQIFHGQLKPLVPHELVSERDDVRTPLGYVNVLAPDDEFMQDMNDLERLAARGFVRKVEQKVAYKHAGMQQYVPLLAIYDKQHDPVYQVTPKGNSLIYLVNPVIRPDDGDGLIDTMPAPNIAASAA